MLEFRPSRMGLVSLWRSGASKARFDLRRLLWALQHRDYSMFWAAALLCEAKYNGQAVVNVSFVLYLLIVDHFKSCDAAQSLEAMFTKLPARTEQKRAHEAQSGAGARELRSQC